MSTRVIFVCCILFLSIPSPGQEKQFVCTPCGSICDEQIHYKPGQCGSCGMALLEKSSITFTNISIEELCARIKANPKAILLDVRSPEEFTGSAMRKSYGHFRNAININVEELEGRLDELSNYKNEEVIVYCSHSHRSPRASHILTTHGFMNVKNMEGGVSTLHKPGECLSKVYVVH